jgi:hypothetical protein
MSISVSVGAGSAAASTAAAATAMPEPPPEFSWRDYTILLLHVPAEIEHALRCPM